VTLLGTYPFFFGSSFFWLHLVSKTLYKAETQLAQLAIATVLIVLVKTFNFLSFVFLTLTIALSSPANGVAFRVHGEGISDNSSVPVVLLNGKKSFLSIQPFLTEADVVAFYPFKTADGKSCGAYLTQILR